MLVKKYLLLLACLLSNQIFAMNKDVSLKTLQQSQKYEVIDLTADSDEIIFEPSAVNEQAKSLQLLADEACKQLEQESDQREKFEKLATENMQKVRGLFQKMCHSTNSTITIDFSARQTLRKEIKDFKQKLEGFN